MISAEEQRKDMAKKKTDVATTKTQHTPIDLEKFGAIET